ncbi:MAG: energy-coupling factor ABC transporter permease [Eubacteriaceae bacterium]|nr:energy-coupling factor ABC transporter permease [Eubacteriaceae bacterium]
MKEKKAVAIVAAIAITLLIQPTANAMHIMEGYLPLGYCIAWSAASAPFLVAGIIKIRKLISEKASLLIILAMSGAFVFVISSLKIPSLTGSCSHMTGTGLAAILFGPFEATALGFIVLVFQAILLAHGGLTSLGANTFSMGIAGPVFTWLLYAMLKKARAPRKTNIFIAASLGDLFTYIVTAMQLALAYPSESGGVMASFVKFLGVFAPTQVPLAVVEGILTVLIIMGLESFASAELEEAAL